MLEDDERVRGLVVDRRDTHHRGPFDGCHALRLGEEALPRGIVGPVAQDLERHDLFGGLVERVPHVGDLVTALEHREAITAGEELAYLTAADRGRGGRLGAVHLPQLTPAAGFVIG